VLNPFIRNVRIDFSLEKAAAEKAARLGNVRGRELSVRARFGVPRRAVSVELWATGRIAKLERSKTTEISSPPVRRRVRFAETLGYGPYVKYHFFPPNQLCPAQDDVRRLSCPPKTNRNRRRPVYNKSRRLRGSGKQPSAVLTVTAWTVIAVPNNNGRRALVSFVRRSGQQVRFEQRRNRPAGKRTFPTAVRSSTGRVF